MNVGLFAAHQPADDIVHQAVISQRLDSIWNFRDRPFTLFAPCLHLFAGGLPPCQKRPQGAVSIKVPVAALADAADPRLVETVLALIVLLGFRRS